MSTPLHFTVDVAPDPEHPTAWVAVCPELGITSAARTPQDAFAALGAAVRMSVMAVRGDRARSLSEVLGG